MPPPSNFGLAVNHGYCETPNSAGQRPDRPRSSDSQADNVVRVMRIGLAAGGMRVEWRVTTPEPSGGLFTPAGTCPGSAAPTLDRTRLPSGPAPAGFGGRAWAGQRHGRCRRAGLASVLMTRTPRSASGTPGADASPASGPCREAVAWRARTSCRVSRDGSRRRSGRGVSLQINSLFCKPICKPDAGRRHETGETEPTERDGICPVRRGQHPRERQHETAETCVVWLITQRRAWMHSRSTQVAVCKKQTRSPARAARNER